MNSDNNILKNLTASVKLVNNNKLTVYVDSEVTQSSKLLIHLKPEKYRIAHHIDIHGKSNRSVEIPVNFDVEKVVVFVSADASKYAWKNRYEGIVINKSDFQVSSSDINSDGSNTQDWGSFGKGVGDLGNLFKKSKDAVKEKTVEGWKQTRKFGAAAGKGIVKASAKARSLASQGLNQFDQTLKDAGINIPTNTLADMLTQAAFTAATGGTAPLVLSALGTIKAVQSGEEELTIKLVAGKLVAETVNGVVPLNETQTKNVVKALCIVTTGMTPNRASLLDGGMQEHADDVWTQIQSDIKTDTTQQTLSDDLGAYVKHYAKNITDDSGNGISTNTAEKLTTALNTIFGSDPFATPGEQRQEVLRNIAENDQGKLTSLIKKINGDPNISLNGDPDAVDVQQIYKHLNSTFKLDGVDINETLKNATSGSQSIQSSGSSVSFSTTLINGETVTTNYTLNEGTPVDFEVEVYEGQDTSGDPLETFEFTEHFPGEGCDGGCASCDIIDRVTGMEAIFGDNKMLGIFFNVDGLNTTFGHTFADKTQYYNHTFVLKAV